MLWNWIAFHARQTPDAPAVILSGRAVSYARFATDIAAAAERLREALPASARLIAVANRRPYVRWVVVLALSRLRLTSTNPGAIKESGADAVVLDAAADTPMPAVVATDPWLQAPLDPGVLAVRDADEDFPMRMIASSGTTGAPKRVLLPASAVVRRAWVSAPAYRLDRATRAFTAMGPGTIGGYTFPCAVWVAGGANFLTEDPLLTPADRPKPTVALLSTGHLDKLLALAGERAEPLFRTRLLIGGGAVAPVTLERARRVLSRQVHIIYASTEAGLVAIDGRDGQPIQPQAVGAVVPGVEVEILGEDGAPAPRGVPGEVRVRSPLLVEPRYLDDPEATGRHFRDGWFYPGDVGMFDADGGLFITGRIGELFNIGGLKVAPIVVENVALGCAGVADAAACMIRDEAGALLAVAVRPSEGFSREDLAARLSVSFPDYRHVIAEIDAIPRNEMGKILRARLTERVQQWHAGAAPAEAVRADGR